MPQPRLAVRAIIVEQDRLLLVNAYPGPDSDLWCAPGGGVECHASLHDNLKREIHEETGLTISVGPLVLVNEFHDPEGDFHQVELFFRCTIETGAIDAAWSDPEGVVTARKWFTPDAMKAAWYKPDGLLDIAFGEPEGASYDPLEPILRP